MPFVKLYPDAAMMFASSGSCNTQSSRTSMLGTLQRLQYQYPTQTVEQFTAAQLADFCVEGSPAPLTVKSRRSRVRAFFGWATYRGLTPTDPSAALKYTVKTSGRGTTEHHWLTEEQVAEVFRSLDDSVADQRARVILMHGFLMGLRRSEIAGLRWDQYSRRHDTVSFVGKGRKLATLGLPTKVQDVVAEWHEQAAPGAIAVLPWVCPEMVKWERPIGDAAVAKVVDRVSERCGIEFLAHDMRRTFAGILEAKGVALSDISRMLRHESVATTATYLEKNPARTIGLANKVEWSL